MPSSVRELHTSVETMQRYMAELERITFAAEVICSETRNGDSGECPMPAGCPFSGWHLCRLKDIREIVEES